MHKLGQEGRDKITGFKGIITCHVRYITGCDQYGLTPKAKNGETKSSQWFDEARIEIIGKGIEIEEVTDQRDPGGPNRDAPPAR